MGASGRQDRTSLQAIAARMADRRGLVLQRLFSLYHGKSIANAGAENGPQEPSLAEPNPNGSSDPPLRAP